MNLTYVAKSDLLDREGLAAAPFADEAREKFVNVLVNSTEAAFTTLDSVSAAEVPT